MKNLNAGFVTDLVCWYEKNKRDLPWRQNTDPYRVWLSEIMLQQTRVEAAKPYYVRFLAALPDIAALAAAPEDRLLKLWEGLGYYSRVRNLQRAARMIMEEHGGVFPKAHKDILRLPGVGAYTAGAIASICFGLPTPAVDGNVLRVLARLTAFGGDTTAPAAKKQAEQQLAALYPPGKAGDFTQALMELGAVMCVPNGAPKCGVCPVAAHCAALRLGNAAGLPVKKPKPPRRVEPRTVFLLYNSGRLAVQKRPAKGLLAGMWEFPNEAGKLDEAATLARAAAWGVLPQAVEAITAGKHIFTHIEWQMRFYLLRCAAADGRFTWATLEELAQIYSLPSAFRLPRTVAEGLSRIDGNPAT